MLTLIKLYNMYCTNRHSSLQSISAFSPFLGGKMDSKRKTQESVVEEQLSCGYRDVVVCH